MIADELPEGGKECKLGDIVKSNRQSIGGDYPYQKILYLDTSSITRGKIDCYQEYLLSDAPSRAKRLVKNNDIVYSTVSPIQRHYVMINNPKKNSKSLYFYKLVVSKQSLLNPQLLSIRSASFMILSINSLTVNISSITPTAIDGVPESFNL